MADVELATLEWVDRFNHERLHSACDRRPPADDLLTLRGRYPVFGAGAFLDLLDRTT